MRFQPTARRSGLCWCAGLLTIASLLLGCAATGPGTNAPAARAAEPPPSGSSAGAQAGRATVVVRVPEALRGKAAAFGQERTIDVPAGFQVSLFAAGLSSPRFMAWSPSGILYVSQPGAGSVVALPDPGGTGDAPEPVVVARGLNLPHGVAFHDGYLYVAENHRVVRFADPGGTPRELGSPEPVVDLAGGGGGHYTRTLGFGPDGKLYVTAGSTCNVCIEKDERRAAMSQYDADGGGYRLYARGLRNSVGFTWRPGTTELWATDNGRDNLGDDFPPDEINVVVDGGDYGWPYCNGDRVPDPQFGQPGRCDSTIPPTVALQAHSAALGLTFYTGSQFPSEYAGDLFVAFHGSWNRSVPTGYKVVRVRVASGGAPPEVEDFATGWLEGGVFGRPVDVSGGPDGALYLTDDKAGVVYRFTYAG